MSGQTNDFPMITDYEDKIRQIKDVISARIIINNKGEIEEIHVLTSANCASNHVVIKEIKSVLSAEYGLHIDQQKITIAQIKDEDNRSIKAQFRPRLMSVTLLTTSLHAEAKVQLKIGDEIYDGIASGANSTNNKLRLIVQATLNALDEYLRGTCNFVAEDILITRLGRYDAILVSLTLVTTLGEESLAGTALVKQDEREATVKATLAAINRRLALLVSN